MHVEPVYPTVSTACHAPGKTCLAFELCGRYANGCFGAVYPFFFVGTTAGMRAYQVSDITSSAPPLTTLNGVPFLPAAVVTNGRRIFFLSAVTGLYAPYTLSIAWLDVPSDPTTATLVAQSAT